MLGEYIWLGFEKYFLIDEIHWMLYSNYWWKGNITSQCSNILE